MLRDWLPKAIVFGSQFFLRKAFLLGCIDYLKEPWELDELEIRLNLAVKQIANLHTFPWGKISITGMNLLHENSVCRLTHQEYTILKILLRHRGEPVPREALFYAIWNNPGKKQSRIIDMHVSSLRKKVNALCSDKAGMDFIRALRGEGYIIPG